MGERCNRCDSLLVMVTSHPDYHDGTYCPDCNPAAFTRCQSCADLRREKERLEGIINASVHPSTQNVGDQFGNLHGNILTLAAEVDRLRIVIRGMTPTAVEPPLEFVPIRAEAEKP